MVVIYGIDPVDDSGEGLLDLPRTAEKPEAYFIMRDHTGWVHCGPSIGFQLPRTSQAPGGRMNFDPGHRPFGRAGFLLFRRHRLKSAWPRWV